MGLIGESIHHRWDETSADDYPTVQDKFYYKSKLYKVTGSGMHGKQSYLGVYEITDPMVCDVVEPDHCPTCNSMDPAVRRVGQLIEYGEVNIACPDTWHNDLWGHDG